VNSSNLTILNSLPVVTLSYPLNDTSTTNRTPLFNWTSQDNDGDSMTYEINISSPQCTSDERYDAEIGELSYVPNPDLQCLYDNGDYYLWKVRANDGEEDGEWSEERLLKLGSYVETSLLINYVDFGFKNISYYPTYNDNTTDDAPVPFVLENTGNAVSNVSVNATALWQGVLGDSNNYMFKMDNYNEAGSFDWLSSITSWSNFSLTGSVVALSNFNYTDSNDTAEMDVFIQVPPNEPPGLRSSTVIFTTSLA